MFFHDFLSRMLQDEHGISITRMAEEDVAATLQISSVLLCRGGRAMAMPNQALAVQQPQGQMQFEQMMQMMMTILPRLVQPHSLLNLKSTSWCLRLELAEHKVVLCARCRL